jgi:biopolymer transport protein ExbD
MAGGTHDDDSAITDINVTPLVDVMLVLLIIFMVTTTQIVKRTIDVELPSADTGENKTITRNLSLTVDNSNTLFVDGTEIAVDQLPQKLETALQEAKKNNEELQALITADKSVAYGEIVKLIDTVRKNGITGFAINVEAPR